MMLGVLVGCCWDDAAGMMLLGGCWDDDAGIVLVGC